MSGGVTNVVPTPLSREMTAVFRGRERTLKGMKRIHLADAFVQRDNPMRLRQ